MDYDAIYNEVTTPKGGKKAVDYDSIYSEVTTPKSTPKKQGWSVGAPSLDNLTGNLKQLGFGGLRGAGSIGSTLLTAGELTPQAIISNLIKGNGFKPFKNDKERRNAMDGGLRDLGANPDSGMYQTGKLGTEIAGTLGTGGALAQGVTKSPLIANSLRSGGLSLGGTTGSKALDVGTRALGGGLTGGVSAGLIDPEYAQQGAVIGAVTPSVIQVAGKAGKGLSGALDKSAKRLMQSALKPTIEQLRTGKAAVAVDTLLNEGLNPTMGGVNKLKSRIYSINDQIDDLVKNSTGTVDKNTVLSSLGDVNKRAINQVSPTSDLNAIQSVADDFANHPLYSGAQIPVQAAQDLKKGTYKALSKSYGTLKGSEIEAQKALARGLKDEIARNVPEISGLNARESALIKTLDVAERRALMEANKNIGGLALLASNPVGFAAFMADKSALFKSLAARMVNQASKGVAPIGNLGNINYIGNANSGALGNFVSQHGLLSLPSTLTVNR